MGMEHLNSISRSVPFLADISSKTKIRPEYLLIVICFFTLLLIQRTILGGLMSNIFSLYVPVRDAILILRSPTPKPTEMKKLIVVLVVLSFFAILESCEIKRILPLYYIIKVIIVFWTFASEDNANLIVDLVLRKIPHDWLKYGDSIQNAVKEATKNVKSTLEKGGSIDVGSSSIDIRKD